jgi:predicted KAP-like P-loop ATPase
VRAKALAEYLLALDGDPEVSLAVKSFDGGGNTMIVGFDQRDMEVRPQGLGGRGGPVLRINVEV